MLRLAACPQYCPAMNTQRLDSYGTSCGWCARPNHGNIRRYGEECRRVCQARPDRRSAVQYQAERRPLERRPQRADVLFVRASARERVHPQRTLRLRARRSRMPQADAGLPHGRHMARRPPAPASRPGAAPRPDLPASLRPDLTRRNAPDPRDPAADPHRRRLLRQHIRARLRRSLSPVPGGCRLRFRHHRGRLARRVRGRLPGRLHPQPGRLVDRQRQRLRRGAQDHRRVLRGRRLRRGQPLGPDRRAGAPQARTCDTRSTAATSRTASTAMPTIV